MKTYSLNMILIMYVIYAEDKTHSFPV
jgi:hypothetical protein